jgi:hypothetical protein
MNEGLENIKQIDDLEKKLNQVLEICKINADYDWDNNTGDINLEFKEIIKIIEKLEVE